MRVLYLCFGLPYPPQSGARIRDFHLLRELAAAHDVTCLCLLEPSDEPKDGTALQEFGITVFGFPVIGETLGRQAIGLAAHVAARRPVATFTMHTARMFEAVRELTTRERFEVVQIEHSLMLGYLDALPRDFRGKTILDLHNIAALQYRRMPQLDLGWREQIGFWFKQRVLRNWEAQHAARFDKVLTVSARDAEWLCAQNPALPVSVIENGVDTASKPFMPEAVEGEKLLFVGALGYPPNADAMVWFCDEIMPRIRRKCGNVRLDIVGRFPPGGVRALAQRDGVQIHTDVKDVRPFYERANVVVVPLRAGGGTRLKILEAMAYGRAVVSTHIGSEGLEVEDGRDLVLADSPSEFAAQVVRLLQNRLERERLTRCARELVETRYTWKGIGAKLRAVYDELA